MNLSRRRAVSVCNGNHMNIFNLQLSYFNSADTSLTTAKEFNVEYFDIFDFLVTVDEEIDGTSIL